MTHKPVRICCTQNHRIATCQPHDIRATQFLLILSLQACSHTTHIPPFPFLFRMHASSFGPTPPTAATTALWLRSARYGVATKFMCVICKQRHSGVSKLCPLVSHCPSFSSNGLVTHVSPPKRSLHTFITFHETWCKHCQNHQPSPTCHTDWNTR
jgi:hypothetical protein